MKIRKTKERNPSCFRSVEGKEKYYAAYNNTLGVWPVEFKTVNIQTRYGSTHIIISGPNDAPPLVLLSAAGLSGTLWIHNIAELSTKFRVYIPDIIVDVGKSIQTRPMPDREDAGEWLSDVLTALKLEKVYLGGISFGGWLSLNFALQVPDRVEKLVLLAPAASLLNFNRGVLLSLKLGRFQWIVPSRFTKSSLGMLSKREGMLNKTFVDQFGIGIKQYRYPVNSVFPLVFTDEELISLNVPTLLIIGDQEIIYDPQTALKRAKKLIQKITTKLFPEAGHLLNVDKPNLFFDALHEFLLT
ncbi:MAG: alpha/beta fold hydrolase [Candidatus Hodarchaeales archaeon]|jgi:pimeloyl-ACP methyl ester carboxylesterase